MCSIVNTVKNDVGNGKNAANQHFLLFCKMFVKVFFFQIVKTWNCVAKNSKSRKKLWQEKITCIFSFSCSCIDRLGAHCFCPICLSAKNFNIGHNFWMLSDRAFIYHMCIPCGKTFSLVPRSQSRWWSNIKVVFFKKEIAVEGALVFHEQSCF